MKRNAEPAPPAPVAIRFGIGGLTVLVDLLDSALRAEFIKSLNPPRYGDPFAPPPGTPERYHTFRVRFDNQSPADVIFQPGNVILVTDRNEQQFPIDLTDVYRQAVRAGGADPEAMMARVQSLIFDSSTTIPTGSRLSRLLVFEPLPRKWKEFRLLFSFLQIGTKTHTLSFAFHKQIEKV